MDFGQLRSDRQESARNMMYQNTGYQFERRDKKTLVLDIVDTASVRPLSTANEFTVELFEPLIVDKLSDVYIDSVSTFNSLLCDTSNRTAFSLSINEFNVNTNVASTISGQQIFNKILIPNENNDVGNVHSVIIHKGKKMNYVCSINPGKISNLSGKITDLGTGSMFSTSTSNADGGRLHYVKLATAATQNVDIGTALSFAGGTSGTGNFVTAFYINEGSTDLYFYSAGSTVSTPASLGAITSTGGLSGIITNTSYYRIGDFPRFTAEFIIEARQ